MWAKAGRLAALGALLGAACGDSVLPEDQLTSVVESTHFVYRASAGDSVDATWQEDYFAWVSGELRIAPTEKLQYLKYRDAAHLARMTGHGCCGFAESGGTTFHTIWNRDNHECVHALVLGYLGHPPALFNEGIAVAHHGDALAAAFAPAAPRWNGTPVHEVARAAQAVHQVPALDQLLESERFFQLPNDRTYPLAGSFVRYLIDTAGIEPLRAYVAESGTLDAAATTRTRFARHYDASLDAWWSRWLAFLAQGS